ncbi:MAG TPA: metallopeptidase TldD-related protein [Actinomycetota bacterium]|nr:metallopeptidase TldD-related protein [Actinomycetota bacterium]
MAEPVGRDGVRAIAEAAQEVPGADAVEVLFVHEWGGLTRFADSAIHQSTWREDTGLRVRVVAAGRVGVVATNDFSKDGAAEAARSAMELAETAAPDPQFAGLAPSVETPKRPDAFDARTAATSPEERAEAVEQLVSRCGDGFHAAGAYDTTASEAAIVNTEGQFCYALATQATLNTVISGGQGGAGFADVAASRAADIDPLSIGERAFVKARDSQDPQDVEAGRYEVVLEPAAVATLVSFLAYLGFGGRSILEGKSCFSGRIGEKLMSEKISIYDDALSPLTLGLPFDFEGTPKQRVDLVGDGVVLGGVHDRRSARQAGVESTGHALPPPNPEGPFPLNLFMATDAATVDDMVRSTKRGLFVSRFHYSNIVHPTEAVITGMTRDGTWLVEDGEIKYPVKNFRFTQSIIEALRDVELVGSESELASEFFFSASRVPALKISSFNFTGKSDH